MVTLKLKMIFSRLAADPQSYRLKAVVVYFKIYKE
jgi:hypothetical protein